MTPDPIPDELRAFYAEVRSDPYAQAITHMFLTAWAHGYETALKQLEEDGRLAPMIARDARGDSFSDLIREAEAWLADDRQRSAREFAIAMAQLGVTNLAGLGEPRG